MCGSGILCWFNHRDASSAQEDRFTFTIGLHTSDQDVLCGGGKGELGLCSGG